MLLVILYHLYCSLQPEMKLILLPFSMGFVGVDIFFFFSAFGLCFSYNKNSVISFYCNRLIRIFPLFIVWAIVHLIYTYYCLNSDFDVIDVLLCFTSLSYYGIGEVRSNWYLSALIMFYIIFPLLFQIGKKLKGGSVILFILFAIFLQGNIEFEWYHQTFISRFPIFLLGIYVWICLNSKEGNYPDHIICMCMLMLVLAITIALFSRKDIYLLVSLVSPVLMFALAIVRKPFLRTKLGQYINDAICFVGRHSLEFFVGNCWTMLLMNEITHFTSSEKTIIYFISNLFFAFVLIPFNQGVMRFFNYKLV